jgi:hypothetical protein
MNISRIRGTLQAVCLLLIAIGLAGSCPEAHAQALPPVPTIGPVRLSSQPEIDKGFRLLYELKFQQAREVFQSWENGHPQEALGPAAEAASYLFEEFDRKGVLTSEFFLNDDRLLGGIEGAADPQTRDAFNNAIQRAQDVAHARLKSDPQNADALFALTISTGMRADYSSLIEKRQIESLRLTREADTVAKNLLSVAPSATDAYVALGAANYILGCLPAYKRFLIRFGGFHGDRVLGMQQLEMAAASGHYLRPYAKLTLGLAAMREKKMNLARIQFEQLVAEFPTNAKFALELAKLREGGHGAIGSP